MEGLQTLLPSQL